MENWRTEGNRKRGLQIDLHEEHKPELAILLVFSYIGFYWYNKIEYRTEIIKYTVTIIILVI